MLKSGSYSINNEGRNRKDASYKNFICALLAFLAMLILISLLLLAFKRTKGSDDAKITDKPQYDYNKGKNNQNQLSTTPKSTTQHSIEGTTIQSSTESSISVTEGSNKDLNSVIPTTISRTLEPSEPTTVLIATVITASVVASENSSNAVTPITEATLSTPTTGSNSNHSSATVITVSENPTAPSTTTVKPTTSNFTEATKPSETIASVTSNVSKDSAVPPATTLKPTSNFTETTRPSETTATTFSTVSQTSTASPSITVKSTTNSSTETTKPGEIIATVSSNVSTTEKPTSSFTDATKPNETIATVFSTVSKVSATLPSTIVTPTTSSSPIPSTETTKPSATITTAATTVATATSSSLVPSTEIITTKSIISSINSTTSQIVTSSTQAILSVPTTSSTTTKIPEVDTTTTESSKYSKYIGEYDSTETTPAPFKDYTCNEAVCKRVSSSMLSMMNHENINKCGDFFNKICIYPEEDGEDRFLSESFKSLIHLINRTDIHGIEYFRDFYDACNNYTHSINRINRMKNFQRIPGSDLSEIVTEAILTQSMPFFDVGLNIRNDTFILEITLPGLSYLKTNIKGWSLREQIKESCIVEIAGSVVDNIVRLNQISSEVDKCIQIRIEDYISQFSQEIEQISKLDNMDFLKNIIPQEDIKMGFFEILNVIQENLALHRNVPNSSGKLKTVTINDLNSNYDLDIDWIKVFGKLVSHNVTGDTNILFSDYLKEVFIQLSDKKYNITEMLNLWSNVQYYKNFVIERYIGNRGHYCMKLTSQLMPEISSNMITNVNNKHTEKVYALIENTATKLIDEIKTSLLVANLGANSVNLIEERLNNCNLKGPELFTVEDSIFPTKVIGSYENQLIELMRAYKKTMYEKAMTSVTSQILLKFFVNAFDTQPRTFPPFKEIVFQPGFVFDVTNDLPNYVILAKKGLPLAQKIFKQIIYSDRPSDQLNNDELIIYEYLNKSSNTANLLGSKYTVEKIECEVEGASEINLNYESIVCDNKAFELVSDLFENEPKDEHLPFVKEIPVEENFITLALQDFCKPNDLADFIADYYNMELPAPIKIKNIVSNSKLFIDTFKC